MRPTTPAAYDYDAFVSYSRQDNPKWVKQFVAELRASDIKLWFDDTQKPGDDWLDNIQNALLAARTCIICFGKRKPDGWFAKEVKAAQIAEQRRTLRIIAVLMPGARDDVIPPLLGSLHRIDCRDGIQAAEVIGCVVDAIAGARDTLQPFQVMPAAEPLSMREQMQRQSAPARSVVDRALACESFLRMLRNAGANSQDCNKIAQRIARELANEGN